MIALKEDRGEVGADDMVEMTQTRKRRRRKRRRRGALHTALSRQRVNFLLDHGADPNIRDAEGNTLLMSFTLAGRDDGSLFFSSGVPTSFARMMPLTRVTSQPRRAPAGGARSGWSKFSYQPQKALERQREAMWEEGSRSAQRTGRSRPPAIVRQLVRRAGDGRTSS